MARARRDDLRRRRGHGRRSAMRALLDGAGALHTAPRTPPPPRCAHAGRARRRRSSSPTRTAAGPGSGSSVLDNVGYTEQAGEKPLVADPNDAAASAVPRRAAERARPPRSSADQDDPGHRVREHDHVHARRPRRPRARRRPHDRVAHASVSATRSGSTSASSSRADHDRSREPRAAAQRRPQPVDHQGASSSSTAKTEAAVALDAYVARGAGSDDLVRAPPVLDARDPDHRCERSPPQAVRRRRRVGFAEIRLRDAHADHDVRVDEVEQMPQDLLDALGARGRPPAGPRDDARRAAPGAAAHRSRARVLVAIRAARGRTFGATGGASVNPEERLRHRRGRCTAGAGVAEGHACANPERCAH